MGVLNWKGQSYSFENDSELIKFAKNLAAVASRRAAAKGYVSPEMQLSAEVRDTLYWREQREQWELQQRQQRQELEPLSNTAEVK